MTIGSPDWSAGRIVRTMLPMLALLALFEVVGSGLILEEIKGSFLGSPVLFLFLPMVIDLGGGLGAIMSSTLSVRIHLGQIVSPLEREVASIAIAVQLLSMTLAVFAAVAAILAGKALGFAAIATVPFLLTATATGTAMGVVIVGIAVGTTFLSVRRGIDPDDIAIPIVTNLCDVAGVLLFSLFILLFMP